jgi:glycosyltransferase involved in cell wall biosynthesis
MQYQDIRSVVYLCLETPREGQAVYTHVHEIISGMESAGWTVKLIATEAGGAVSGGSYWRRGLGYISAQIKGIRLVHQCDAVYFRSHFAALPLALVCRVLGKPTVQEINGRPSDVVVTYPWLRWLKFLIEASYRYQMQWASEVITVTDGLRQWAITECRHSRVSVVPNGANTIHFTSEGNIPEGMGDYIVFVGGLVAWHGISTMLSAIDQPEWPEGVRLVIIGDGIEREKVLAAVSRPRLVWLGRKPYEDIPQYLRGAMGALCVIEDPDGRSATGVAPLKLFEAMACGVPVIVTDLPFQADLVRQQGAGIVVPIADPVFLAKAVAALFADPSAGKKMGMRGADYVRKYASWQARADQTCSIVKHAIHPGLDR